ncbi:MAG: hypothetical protein HY703_11675 [Gemmatimonadetes bacterium]|nr:hypothetical protein [Gemmatimonadota bacterium]
MRITAHSFEELAARELDALYQAALFLSAGNQAAAEELLLETLTRAFGVFHVLEDDENAGLWLHGRLIQDYLGWAAAAAAPPTPEAQRPGRRRREPPRNPASETKAMYRAAHVLPPDARAAIWLVIFRRWRYAEAATALGRGTEELRPLLQYRDAFLAEVVRLTGGTREQGLAVN